MRSLLLPLVLLGCHASLGPRPSLVTTAERTGWKQTGRHAEAVQLCRDFERAYPGRARCEHFGTSAEQRELVALIVSDDGALSPAKAKARQRPVLLIQAGIHAGEIEGKDAGFALLRDLLDGKVAAGTLDAVTIVFIPIFNVDGHERFGPGNRPNQRGPEEMGWRTTSRGLNLNRDHVKVDAPEMVAQHLLWNRWDPVVYVDLHTTDGAKFEHDVAVLVSPKVPRGDDVDEVARALSDQLQARVAELGHLPLPFYPSFVDNNDPATGFEDGEPPPRFSQTYAAARNRIGILVETHSWRTYEERGLSTYHVLQALFEDAVTNAGAWRDAADVADAVGDELGGKEVTLLYAATATTRTIAFRGYHYERVPSEVSGGTWTQYDETRPEVWQVPMRDEMAPALIVTAPRGGYLVTAGFADVVAARLDAHGLDYTRLDAALTADAEVWRATAVNLRGSTYEGRTPAQVEGEWTKEQREVAAGALWVPIAQPHARLVLELLEPSAPDSMTAWGFFNAVFEQKEYMEPYVAEEEARAMLEDPAIRAAFDEALQDAAFAGSPEQRLQWFYQRHPSWDERKDLLPVLRLDAAPVR